jgi:hypothetical protein
MSDLKRWADTWARAGRAIAEVNARNPIDRQQAVLQLMPVFRLAREALPHTTTSGLIEMRRLLDRRHR